MGTEFTTNMLRSLMTSTANMFIWLILLGVIALLIKIFSSLLPNKYRDGKIAPKITDTREPDYITNLNKEMEEAGVDNLRDLEQFREHKN